MTKLDASELWKQPLLPAMVRLELALSAIQFRDEVIEELLGQIEGQAAEIGRLTVARGRAERALTRAGYTYVEGAAEWKPPLGKAPDYESGMKSDVEGTTIFLSLESVSKIAREACATQARHYADGATLTADMRDVQTAIYNALRQAQLGAAK